MADKREVFLTLIQRNFYTVLKYSGARTVAAIERALELSKDEHHTLKDLATIARSSSEGQFNEHLLASRGFNDVPLSLAAVDAVLEHRSSHVQRKERELFHELLRGKRVAIVGAADSISGQKYGTYIDSFDLVVRINFHWPVPLNQQADRGSRLDILYHCCNGDFPVRDLFVHELDLARFVCWMRNRESTTLERFCLENNIPSLDVSDTHTQIADRIGSPPNTGTVAIAHLLTTELTQLFVTGFSFQATPYSSATVSKGSTGDCWRHQSAAQIRFFRELVLSDTRLLVDHPLHDLLTRYGVSDN